jgi:hypothetical protein
MSSFFVIVAMTYLTSGKSYRNTSVLPGSFMGYPSTSR